MSREVGAGGRFDIFLDSDYTQHLEENGNINYFNA